jgi:hypothetical protein
VLLARLAQPAPAVCELAWLVANACPITRARPRRAARALVPLTQAWFPAHAEVWNAPTWFLSALTFAMLVLPHVLPAIAAMRKRGLQLLLVRVRVCGAVVVVVVVPARRGPLLALPLCGCAPPCRADRACLRHTLTTVSRARVRCFARARCPPTQLGLTGVSLVSKLAYSYDLGAWTFLEGMMGPKQHPNMLLWNVTRFNPFYCLLEVRVCVCCVRFAGWLESVVQGVRAMEGRGAWARLQFGTERERESVCVCVCVCVRVCAGIRT